MAFKRYIYKHGKKLGPYYYENVRGKDGNVKTVYLGTNPQHHTKHRIRKPLFFLILVFVLILILGGSLFLLQNKAYLIKKARLQQPDFDIDQILLKVLVRSSEFIVKDIRVMNTGSEPVTISIETLSLEDIVNIDSSSFAIKPGQTKIVTLNFSAIAPEQKIEQQPGIYIGKLIVASQKASKEIPVLVEIETKNVLFDMNLNPVAIERNVKQGSDTTIEVRLFNLESIESVNVDVEYFVKDINGNTIVTESETVVAKTQASFFKTISIPKNLKPGPYVFAAKSKFGSSVGTASYLFYVIGPEVETSFVQFCKNNLLCLGLSLTTILLLFALMAYFYFFIGAYLYEKVTGVITLPKRKEKYETEELEEEAEKPGIFESIKDKISEWKAQRGEEKAEKEKLKKDEELQSLTEERKAQFEEKKRLLEEEVKAKELERKEEFLREQAELEAKRAKEEKRRKQVEDEKRKQEGLKRQEELRKQKEIEAKQREGEAKRKKIEKKKLWSERKKKAEEFLHKFGMFKTPEEKRQIELQKEKEKQERLRREEELKRQKEQQRIEEEKRQEELQRKRELEQKSKEEEERRREEALRKQKEAEAKKKEEEQRRALEQKKKLEEEKRRKLEQEESQRELERQRQEKIKAKKLEEINEVEAGLRKNKEAAELLNSKILRLESEKGPLSNNISELDARIKHIDDEIIEKLKHSKVLALQKNSLDESYKKQIDELSNIKELKAALAEKRSALTKELEEELSQLSQEKRKSVEKWKRLELKAKLKIEEHALEEELKNYEIKAIDKKKKIEEGYRGHLKEISKKQRELKQEIANLESHKEQILREKNKLLENLQDKETRIQKTKLKLENNAKEQEYLISELSKLKSELPKFSLGIFSSLIPSQKEKIEVMIEGRKLEERRKEEGKKREEFERQRLWEGRKQKFKESLHKFGMFKTPEEKRQIALQKEKERQELIHEGQLKRQKELEAKKLEEEKKKEQWPEEEKPKERKKAGLFERLFKKKEPEFGLEDIKRELEEEEVSQKKPSFLGKVLGKAKEEEAPKEQKPAKSDLEELEESIRSLGLFKELERGAGKEKFEIPKKKASIFARLFKKKQVIEKESIKEEFEEQKPEKIITGKSKDFEKCHKALIEAKGAFGGGNLQKAKKLYAEARNHYISLNYQEKKDIYNELMELYNKLK